MLTQQTIMGNNICTVLENNNTWQLKTTHADKAINCVSLRQAPSKMLSQQKISSEGSHFSGT